MGKSLRPRLAGRESGAAMLTNNLLAEILDTDLQIAAASRAFLDEVSATRHTASPSTGDTFPRDQSQAMRVLSICGVEAGINDFFSRVGRSLFQADAKSLLEVHLRQMCQFNG